MLLITNLNMHSTRFYRSHPVIAGSFDADKSEETPFRVKNFDHLQTSADTSLGLIFGVKFNVLKVFLHVNFTCQIDDSVKKGYDKYLQYSSYDAFLFTVIE